MNSPLSTDIIRVLHTSDWQIGMTRHFLDNNAQARFTEARLDAISAILRLAAERDCHAIVVAGDVFDSNLLQPEVYRPVLDMLKRSAVPVFLLPGNHDPYDPASVYRNREIQATVADSGTLHILSDTAPHELRPHASGPTLTILGAPLLAKKSSSDLVADVLSTLDTAPARSARVLVGHGPTSSFGGTGLDIIDVDSASRACAERLVDVVALGDTHSTVALDGEAQRVWYSGAPEVTDFLDDSGTGERDSGNVLIHSIDFSTSATAPTVSTEVIPVGSWRFEAWHADINTASDVEAFVERLDAVPTKRTTVIKYALRGTIDLATHEELQRHLDIQGSNFAALYPRTRLTDLHVIPSEADLEGLTGFGGFIGAAAEELVRATREHPDDPTSLDALKELFRLADATAE